MKFNWDLTDSWSSWGLSGNENKFRQYATAPHGFNLSEFRFRLSDQLRNDGEFDFKGPGEDDYRHSGLLRLNAGTTKIWATDFRNRFSDPDPTVIQGSERRVTEGYLWQKLLADFSISARTRLTDQKETIAEPSESLSQSTRVSDVAARGSLWRNGFVDLGFSDTRFIDRTNLLPNTSTQRLSAGVMQQIGDSLALSGSYAHSTIRQPNAATDKVDEFGFGGNLLIGDDTNLLLDYRNERLDLPTVIQAYDRRRQQARARIVRRLGMGWTAQFGYNQLALERLRDDHTFVDVPRLHTLDMEVNGRLSRSARLTAKISHETMQGSAEMQVLDPRALYWTSHWDGQVKLDAHNSIANAYLVFDWHENKNGQRDVTVRHQGLTLGAEWSLRPELEFYSEISTDLWTGHTGDSLSPDLDNFFPDATTFTAGANWTINPKTWATGNYTFYTMGNDQRLNLPGASIWGSFFTGTLHYKAGKDLELGLAIAPWQFVDTLAPNAGFTTGLVRFTAKTRF